jgi:hypothetical protein
MVLLGVFLVAVATCNADQAVFLAPWDSDARAPVFPVVETAVANADPTTGATGDSAQRRLALEYEENGRVRGGYSLVGTPPKKGGVAMVIVDTTPETMGILEASGWERVD